MDKRPSPWEQRPPPTPRSLSLLVLCKKQKGEVHSTPLPTHAITGKEGGHKGMGTVCLGRMRMILRGCLDSQIKLSFKMDRIKSYSFSWKPLGIRWGGRFAVDKMYKLNFLYSELQRGSNGWREEEEGCGQEGGKMNQRQANWKEQSKFRDEWTLIRLKGLPRAPMGRARL